MTSKPPFRIVLPPVPALVTGVRHAIMLDTHGEFLRLNFAETVQRLQNGPVLVCHRPAIMTRLGVESLHSLDVLELFAFCRPAQFCIPTPKGLAGALNLALPADLEDEAELLLRAARVLLTELAERTAQEMPLRANDTRSIALIMHQAGWGWGPGVMAALGLTADDSKSDGLKVWQRLPEWSEFAPEAPPSSHPVSPDEARRKLAEILGSQAEQRPSQSDYASACTKAFLPRENVGEPNVVLAEAGTGTGKTLGYIAPSSLWAAKNGAPVWISTYTRNLQRQLDQELDRAYPDPLDKSQKVVIRKGRENYLCLLNYDDQISRDTTDHKVASGLMARWVLNTRDGALIGGDFPGWLVEILGRARTMGLADRRGECIYSGCPHFNVCFIERAIRKARRAEIVVANHALVMIQAALGGLDDNTQPNRYVFDEGHHIFDAADSAFSAHLSGIEGVEIRRWLMGAEDGSRSRARGIKARADDLLGLRPELPRLIDEIMHAAQCLPASGWQNRIMDGATQIEFETFLSLIRQQVYAHAGQSDSPYSIEAECTPLIDGMAEAAQNLAQGLARIKAPLIRLVQVLQDLLDDEAAGLDTNQRNRIEGLTRSIDRRAIIPLSGWIGMLDTLSQPELPEGEARKFVDWFTVDRREAKDWDMGMHRHWVDPTLPFVRALGDRAHGMLITSATLRDGTGSNEKDWFAAERRTGARFLNGPVTRAAVPSPFDYVNQTRVIVVNDVRKDDMRQVAAAYRELFLAANGGALGLFTAISRLKSVYQNMAEPLEDAGLRLLAQHVDGLDTSTLIDIFRAEEDACLLGTDAVRDGVDVPGRSLRLIVFDRVPWPRPDILHKARREAFGGKYYDDMLARFKLKQAFGRLIRRNGDHGVFVLLDPMMPQRIFGAFPPGVVVRKMGLAQAVAETREFLKSES